MPKLYIGRDRLDTELTCPNSTYIERDHSLIHLSICSSRNKCFGPNVFARAPHETLVVTDLVHHSELAVASIAPPRLAVL